MLIFKVSGKCCRNIQVFAQIILKCWITLRHTITGKSQDLENNILIWLMRFSSFLNFLLSIPENVWLLSVTKTVSVHSVFLDKRIYLRVAYIC